MQMQIRGIFRIYGLMRIIFLRFSCREFYSCKLLRLKNIIIIIIIIIIITTTMFMVLSS